MAPVQLYVYDLSQGMARILSPQLLGMQLDGIWHTGVVVYDKEYFFGGGAGPVSNAVASQLGVIGDVITSGVRYCPPGGTILGNPQQTIPMGETEVDETLLEEYLTELANSSFRVDTYRLFEHNCNHFSNELTEFLTGKSVPDHILNLPQAVMNTPFGGMLRSMFGDTNV